jgi:hypothetical protein
VRDEVSKPVPPLSEIRERIVERCSCRISRGNGWSLDRFMRCMFAALADEPAAR